MDLNDPLRIGAYGTKKDMREKGMIKQAQRKGSKRYYPKHKQVLYDEWAAMIQHQQETVSKGDLQGQQHLLKARKDQGKSLQRNYQIQDLSQKQQASKDIENIQKAVNLNLRQNLVESYQNQRNFKNDFKNHDKLRTIQEGQQMNNQAERLIQADQLRKVQLKNMWKSVQNQDLKQRYEKKKMERQTLDQQKRQYIDQMKQQQKREVDRDIQYRKYFNNVENKIQRNYESLKKYIDPKISDTQSVAPSPGRKINEDIRADKDIRKSSDHHFKLKELNHVEDQTALYQIYMNQAKQTQKLQKEKYKHFLDEQKYLKNQMKGGYGSMTQQERRFNHQDLRSYKKKEAQNDAMIPGLTLHQQRPARLGNLFKRMYDPGTYFYQNNASSIPSIRHQQSEPDFNDISKEANNSIPQNHMASYSTLVGPNNFSMNKPQNGNNSFNTPVKDRVIKQVGLANYSPEPVGYNPIVNPISGINQNPVLRKMANQGVGGIAINSSNLFGGLDGRPMRSQINSQMGASPKMNGGSVLNQAGKSILQ